MDGFYPTSSSFQDTPVLAAHLECSLRPWHSASSGPRPSLDVLVKYRLTQAFHLPIAFPFANWILASE